MSTEETCSIIAQKLQSQIDTYGIKVEPAILSEASVSSDDAVPLNRTYIRF